MTATPAAAIDTARDLLKAADTDIAVCFGYFADDRDFRTGNAEIVRGRQNIKNRVASYLGSVAGMRHGSSRNGARGMSQSACRGHPEHPERCPVHAAGGDPQSRPGQQGARVPDPHGPVPGRRHRLTHLANFFGRAA